MVEMHKESRDPEPLTLTKHTVENILESVGVEHEKIEKFSESMDAQFGLGANLTPKNVVSYNKFELKMPDIKINVSPEYRDNVSTREIDGEKYILIKVIGPVEINGIAVNTDTEPDGE
jgi:hypothetical protein